MLRKEHPEKTWLNCGLDVLCVMFYYDGDDLARIIEKVLRKCSTSVHLAGYMFGTCGLDYNLNDTFINCPCSQKLELIRKINGLNKTCLDA